MIPELGHYALILALCLALVQATVPLWGAWRKDNALMALSRYAALGQCFFALVSFFILVYCFASNDFSVAYVAENSNTHLPLAYRLCAIWGAHEGSLLLWVTILTLWMAAVSLFSQTLPLEMRARVLAVLSMIAVGFYLFLLTTSDPFLRLLPYFPSDGRDLNPLLQDPGLVSHPPMLYMGYVGFSVAFAFAISALINGRLDAAWARWTRPWTMVAWCFLTLGIVLGSWWSYRELGWGGWWFWDPVENASFLPWLAGTALIHCLIVTEKRNAFKAWTVLLAVIAFSLSLLGTFLVRSGILISVHAFSVDPKRGAFVLVFLMLVVGMSLTLYAWRASRIVNRYSLNTFSRETMLLSNNIILFVAMLTVLLGTLYPLVIDAFNLGKLSVGAPYFNAVFMPLMIPLLFLMGVGPLFHWGYRDPRLILKRCFVVLCLVLGSVFALLSFAKVVFYGEVVLFLSLAFWVIFNTFPKQLRAFRSGLWGMRFAHWGVAVTVIGIVLSNAYSVDRDLRMKLNEAVTIGPYQFTLDSVDPLTGPNYTGARATVSVYRALSPEMLVVPVAVLHPEERVYTVQKTALSKVGINASITRDLYVALSEALPNQAWSMRIYYKPFIRWIWFGGLLMVFGGLLTFWDRRFSNKRTAS